MTYRDEFADFPASDMPKLPEGFIDTSWHNDTCPSFSHEIARLILFVDYLDPRERELDQPRFTLCEITKDGQTGDCVAACEYWDDMLREISVRLRSAS